MKTLTAIGLIMGAIYANGPATVPIMPRMAISVESLMKTFSPTLCSDSKAQKEVLNKVSFYETLQGQSGTISFPYWWNTSSDNKEIPTKCHGIIMVNQGYFTMALS
jgi:hypothetical protein